MKFKHLLFSLLFVGSSSWAQVQPFDLQEVKLQEGTFKNAQDLDIQYILKLDVDKLLAPYYIDAGITVKKERYGNWESSGLDGHIGGHYLSALAIAYAASGHSDLLHRLNYMVGELALCQARNGNGYVGGIPQGKIFWERIKKGDIDGSSFGLNNSWVPLYNIHKLFAGLRDAYLFAQNEQALQVLLGLSDWMIDLFQNLNDEQIEQVLRTEHGGLNEVFVDVYQITREEKYLQWAQRLTHKAFLNPLILGEDRLTGMHANTQIPKVVGIEKITQVTQSTDWAKASEFFWDNVANKRSVAFGGNSYREHFHELDRFDKMLETNQGPETCNSYNMLKLSKALYFRTNEPRYLDFYEKTLFNHILSSQHPSHGGLVYFTPIRPNHYRVYSQPETSMWCCVGTGIENHIKYGELIYAHSDDVLYVNLLISSSVQFNQLTLTQQTQFPYENKSVLEIKGNGYATIALRTPSWMKQAKISVNGKKVNAEASNGFVYITRKWKTNDKVSLQFEMELTQEFLPNTNNWVAFKYGPIVLASETSQEDLKGLLADDSRMGHETKGKLFPLSSGKVFVSSSKSLTSKFKYLGNAQFAYDGVVLKPFFAVHDTRYQMYFQYLSPEQYEAYKAQLASEKAFEESIVDRIQLGEQQPEADHAYRGEKSNSGYDHGKFWRNTQAYISYELLNAQGKAKTLFIESLDPISQENIRVELNGVEKKFQNTSPNQIQLKLDSSESVRIRIQPSKSGTSTPRLTQIIIN